MSNVRASTGSHMRAYARAAVNVFLAAVLVLSMAVNSFVPRFALTVDEEDTLSQIIAGQSTLLKFFSLSSVPLSIVEEIFSEMSSTPLTSRKESPSPKKQPANQGADSITVSQSSGSTVRFEKEGTQSDRAIFGAFVPSVMSADILTAQCSPGYPWAGMFIVLCFMFFMLPRSNVSDHAVMTAANRANPTQLEISSWVFYLLKNTNASGRVS